MKRFQLIVVLVMTLYGCTDASRAQLGSLGNPGTIECYSGGKAIYIGKSTGKIATEQGSDGWYFNDAATDRLVRVSGDCVIKN